MVRQEKEAIRSRTKLQDKAHLDSVRLRSERVTRLNQLQVSTRSQLLGTADPDPSLMVCSLPTVVNTNTARAPLPHSLSHSPVRSSGGGREA